MSKPTTVTEQAEPEAYVGLTPEYMDRVQAETKQFEYWSQKSAELSDNLAKLSQQIELGGDKAAVAKETIAKLDAYKKLIQDSGHVKVNGPWEVSADVKAQFDSVDKRLNALAKQILDFAGDSKDMDKSKGSFGKWLKKSSTDISNIVETSQKQQQDRHKEVLEAFHAQKMDMLEGVENTIKTTLAENVLTRADYDALMKSLTAGELRDYSERIKTSEEKGSKNTEDSGPTEGEIKKNSQVLASVQSKVDNIAQVLDPLSPTLDTLLQKPAYDKELANDILAGINDLKKTQSDPQPTLDSIKKQLGDLAAMGQNDENVISAINDVSTRVNEIKVGQEKSHEVLSSTLETLGTKVEEIKKAPSDDYTETLKSINELLKKTHDRAVGEAETLKTLFEKVADLTRQDEVEEPKTLKDIQDTLAKLENQPSPVDYSPRFDALSNELEQLKSQTTQLAEIKATMEDQHTKTLEGLDSIKNLPAYAGFTDLLKDVQEIKELADKTDPELSISINKISEQLALQDKLIMRPDQLKSILDEIINLVKSQPKVDTTEMHELLTRIVGQIQSYPEVLGAINKEIETLGIKAEQTEKMTKSFFDEVVSNEQPVIKHLDNKVDALLKRPEYPTSHGDILQAIQSDVGEIKNRPTFENPELVAKIHENINTLINRPQFSPKVIQSDEEYSVTTHELLQSIHDDIGTLKGRPSQDPAVVKSIQEHVHQLVERPTLTDTLKTIEDNVHTLVEGPKFPVEIIESNNIIKELRKDITDIKDVQPKLIEYKPVLDTINSNLVTKEDFELAIGSLNTKVSNLQDGIKGPEIVQLSKETHKGIQDVRNIQDQKISTLETQNKRIETKVDQIKYADEGFGGQMKQLRKDLNGDFDKALKKVQKERHVDTTALEQKIDQVNSLTKNAVTGVGILAVAGVVIGIWQWLSNRGRRNDKAKRSYKYDKRSHARSWIMEPPVDSKWTGETPWFPANAQIEHGSSIAHLR